MKVTVFAILLFLVCSSADAQITFAKSDVIGESYAMSQPIFIKKGDYFYLLKIATNKITQVKLDTALHQVDQQVYKLKGIERIKYFEHNNEVYIVGINKDYSLTIYAYDPETGVASSKKSFNLAQRGAIKSPSIKIVETLVGDGVGLVIELKDTYPRRVNVVMMNSTFDNVLWQKLLVTPTSIKTDEGIMNYSLTEINFHTAISMSVGTLGSRLNVDNELTTDLYQFEGNELKKVWSTMQTQGEIEDKFQSTPTPFIHNNKTIQYYQIECELKSGEITLFLNDANHDEIKHYLFKSGFTELGAMKRVQIAHYISSTDLNFENGTFNLLITELLDFPERTADNQLTSQKTYLLRYKKNGEEIEENGVIALDYYRGLMDEVNGFLIEDGRMSYYDGNSKQVLKVKEIFDRATIASGGIWHFVIGGELYSMYSEYSTFNMTAQVVRWIFPE